MSGLLKLPSLYKELTSHKVSLYSIRLCTASTARKLFSISRFLAPECRMLGAMTVARLWMSILLPDSSSTVEKDDTQFRNVKITSIVSRCACGSRQHVKCNTCRRFSSSGMPALVSLVLVFNGVLTSCPDEEFVQLMCQDRIGQVAKELFQ
jgi:hypothetical protein